MFENELRVVVELDGEIAYELKAVKDENENEEFENDVDTVMCEFTFIPHGKYEDEYDRFKTLALISKYASVEDVINRMKRVILVNGKFPDIAPKKAILDVVDDGLWNDEPVQKRTKFRER
jgi:hypothetical protein